MAITEETVMKTVEELKKARQVELDKGQAHAKKRAQGSAIEAQIDARQKHVVAMGYAGEEPAISGGNADTRKAQEVALLNEDDVLKELSATLESNIQEQLDSQDEYEKSKIERRYWEDMLNAQRAILIAYGIDRADALPI